MMDKDIRDILFNEMSFFGQETFHRDLDNSTEKITKRFKSFILWLHDPKCPFNVNYNGIDKTKPKISYKKGDKDDKFYTLDEVWKYWKEHTK